MGATGGGGAAQQLPASQSGAAVQTMEHLEAKQTAGEAVGAARDVQTERAQVDTPGRAAVQMMEHLEAKQAAGEV